MDQIIKALNAVMKDVGAVHKKELNQHQNFNFRGIDAVVNAVYPAFVKHGIIYAPRVVSAEYETGTTARGGTMQICRLLVEAGFWHTSGEHIETVVAAEAFDHGDKATAKAMSVAMRTALLQVLALPTDDPDPDSFSYQVGAQNAAGKYAHMTDVDELRDLWRETSSLVEREAITARVKEIEAGEQA